VAKHVYKKPEMAQSALTRPPVFDHSRFDANTMGDAALQVEILALFGEQLASVQEKLAAGPLSQSESKFLGHTLRGSAAAVGAREIEELAANWEDYTVAQEELQPLLREAIRKFEKAVS
jgi:HPt (histidine-containing phosphotransfer) domain-containing protein